MNGGYPHLPRSVAHLGSVTERVAEIKLISQRQFLNVVFLFYMS